MDAREKEKLVRLGGQQIRFDFPMAQLTTLGVGGQCQALFEANDLEDLQRVIAYISEEHIPYLVVGKGSNLLVKDEGFDGLVILLRGSLAAAVKDKIDDLSILAGAGLPLVDLLSYCRSIGLGGLECFAGIPGTVGGAVAMNAGAFGEEFGSKIQEIYLITQRGDLVLRDRSQLRFSYRKLEIEKGAVIIRARFKLYPQSEEIVAGRIVDYLKRRKESQPLEYPSAGSVFKNPPNDYAGKLIEDAGLKGKNVGGAMISKKHANFIVNTGGATAKDVLALLYLAQEEVKKKTGIELEPEIQVVGN
jgi:UDP-N-acetylmuramate dehydrogenase